MLCKVTIMNNVDINVLVLFIHNPPLRMFCFGYTKSRRTPNFALLTFPLIK